MLVFYLAAALVAGAWSQSTSSCSYEDGSGYSLKWAAQNGQISFNLTFRNFQPNSYTGVAFGDNAAFGLDAILVTVVNNQVQVIPTSVSGQNAPSQLNDRSVTTQSASYRDRVLNALFARPVALTSNGHKSLSGCNTWNFYTTPGSYNNGQFTVQNNMKQMKVCNVEQTCQGTLTSGMNVMSPNRNELGSQNQQYNNNGYNANGANNGFNYNQGFNDQQQGQQGFQYQQSSQGQGVNFGYVPNTATIPPRQPYTGTPFVYTTTMDPTTGNFNNQRTNNGFNNQLFTSNANANSAQGYNAQNPNSINYNPGAGSTPSKMFDPYNGGQNGWNVGQGAQQANQKMYDANSNQYPNSQPSYQGFYSSSNNQFQATNQNQRLYDSNSNSNSQYNQNNANQNQRMFDANQQGQYQGYYPSSSNQRMYNPSTNQNPTANYNAQFNPNGQAQNQRMYDPNTPNAYGQNYQQQPQYQPMPSSFAYQQNPQYSYGRKRRSVFRVKRQSSGYQPTNNIYGYNYDSNSQGSSGTTLVMNPNYKYLSGPLADEYSRTYAQEVRMYDQNGGASGASASGSPSSRNLNGNAPILNNDQQNTANYQQIQQDYARNPNPTAGQAYTNNIYGYNYASSGSSSPAYASSSSGTAYAASSSSGAAYATSSSTNRQYDQSSANLFYPSNPYSTTAAPIRQFDPSVQRTSASTSSGSNLKETRLRDPNQYQQYYTGGVARDYVPGTSPNTPFEYTYFDAQSGMFYPYRTTTNWQPYNSTYYDTNGVVSSSNMNNGALSTGASSGVMYDSTTGRMRDGSDACGLQDPYWCDYYVKIFLGSQQQYNFSTQPMACQALISSLQDSYNGCCNTVRSAGCQA